MKIDRKKKSVRVCVCVCFRDVLGTVCITSPFSRSELRPLLPSDTVDRLELDCLNSVRVSPVDTLWYRRAQSESRQDAVVPHNCGAAEYCQDPVRILLYHRKSSLDAVRIRSGFSGHLESKFCVLDPIWVKPQ